MQYCDRPHQDLIHLLHNWVFLSVISFRKTKEKCEHDPKRTSSSVALHFRERAKSMAIVQIVSRHTIKSADSSSLKNFPTKIRN